MAVKRIMIVGGAGAGKSTAARMIGAKLGLPVFYMDREVYWLPGWEERSHDARMARVEEIVARESWVFEGSFSRTYDMRLERAQMLIWLETPLWLRLWRAVWRAVRQRGRTREDMAPGCVEQLRMLPGFVWFIISTHGRGRRRAEALFNRARIQKYRLKTAREVNAFVDGM